MHTNLAGLQMRVTIFCIVKYAIKLLNIMQLNYPKCMDADANAWMQMQMQVSAAQCRKVLDGLCSYFQFSLAGL